MINSGSVVVVLVFSLVPGLAGEGEGVFDANGVKIRYHTAGKGEPIVLLHGWMSDASMWGRLDTNPAAQEYQLIAMDFRGHGKSDKPHEVDRYGPEMAEDVVRLLDHLKLPKAHLVGYSMGAIVAGKVAATHPDRVLSVVYGGQAPILAGGVKADAREIEVFAKAVEEGKDLGAYLLEVTPPERLKLTAAQAKAVASMLYGGKDVKAFAAAGRGIKNLDVTEEQLKKCPAPILFVHGARESDATKQRAAVITKSLDRGDIKVIPDADHVTTLSKPEFGKVILEFLRANKQRNPRGACTRGRGRDVAAALPGRLCPCLLRCLGETRRHGHGTGDGPFLPGHMSGGRRAALAVRGPGAHLGVRVVGDVAAIITS